jgi:ABC-type glycerol-3-phosphate transport system permease component
MKAVEAPLRGSAALARAPIYLGLVLACFISVAPFLYLISAAFRKSSDLFEYPPQWIPSHPYLGHFTSLLTDWPFPRWVANTLVVAGTVTLLKILFDSMAGYALAKMEFAGRRAVLGMFLATVMIPPSVLILPLFFLVRDLGGVNTYWALILPPLANPVGIFMMRGFIQGLPRNLEQAARLDDCSEFGIYWRIVLPLVKPGLVVVGIYTFLVQYTSFAWPLVITTGDNLRLLTTGLASLRTEHQPDWGLISSASLLAMVPITIVFLLFQRVFVQASLSGAVKG